MPGPQSVRRPGPGDRATGRNSPGGRVTRFSHDPEQPVPSAAAAAASGRGPTAAAATVDCGGGRPPTLRMPVTMLRVQSARVPPARQRSRLPLNLSLVLIHDNARRASHRPTRRAADSNGAVVGASPSRSDGLRPRPPGRPDPLQCAAESLPPAAGKDVGPGSPCLSPALVAGTRRGGPGRPGP